MLQAAPFLLKFYNSFEFTRENDCPFIAKPRNELQLFIPNFKKFINVCVYSFFFLKSCRKISWTCDQITHYIYFFFFNNKPNFIKKN